jgi:hypothetical protein
LFWAVILVALGFLFLANNLGLIAVNVWSLFWPVFLILLGVWFLVGSQRGGQDVKIVSGSVDLGDAARAGITIKHGAGRLTHSGKAESGKLVSGTFALGLDSRVKTSGDKLDVVLQPSTPDFPDIIFPWNWFGGRGIEWDFSLSDQIPLDLVFEIGAVDAHLDLSELNVKDLVIKTGASSTNLTLPAAAGASHLKIEAGAATLNVKVPEGVAARIEASAGLATVSVDQARFPRQNGYYQSPDYDSAANKVDIRIETGMATIDIG